MHHYGCLASGHRTVMNITSSGLHHNVTFVVIRLLGLLKNRQYNLKLFKNPYEPSVYNSSMSNSLHLSLSARLSNRPEVSANHFLGFATVREERSVLASISLLQSSLIRPSPMKEILISRFITYLTRQIRCNWQNSKL